MLEITNGNWNIVFCPVMNSFMASIAIGGRGVGIWEGDQPNLGRGEWFLDPQGGTSSVFLRGERKGNKRQNQKTFLIAAERRRNFWQF